MTNEGSNPRVRVTSVRAVKVGKDAAGFKRAAETYVRKATSTAKAAHDTLKAIGIYDAKGALTKNYRG